MTTRDPLNLLETYHVQFLLAYKTQFGAEHQMWLARFYFESECECYDRQD